MGLGLWINMKKFSNLSDLQCKFIRNCFIFLGFIAWLVFGFVSVANEWGVVLPYLFGPVLFLGLIHYYHGYLYLYHSLTL